MRPDDKVRCRYVCFQVLYCQAGDFGCTSACFGDDCKQPSYVVILHKTPGLNLRKDVGRNRLTPFFIEALLWDPDPMERVVNSKASFRNAHPCASTEVAECLAYAPCLDFSRHLRCDEISYIFMCNLIYSLVTNYRYRTIEMPSRIVHQVRVSNMPGFVGKKGVGYAGDSFASIRR
ncbi:hypothetical protein CBM2599_A10299 [Cupriavidus taiwanensis]|nr:hypothetical protein CBM2599_A10299 [Cupriavidus taiwanensis]SOY80487.1 hypothetical protein CBM2600_A10144 [Cupriavidus taiwanensis]